MSICTGLACSDAPEVVNGALVRSPAHGVEASLDESEQQMLSETETLVTDPDTEALDGSPVIDAKISGETMTFGDQEELSAGELPVRADHGPFDVLLRKYVSIMGEVNYAGFRGNAEFDRYLKHLSTTPPREDWSRAEKMSYWINAYNAFTIQLINDNWPVESIKDISSPWKKKFIVIDGESFDLNTIEHDILRPHFSDPRIHFAINCASESCPKLLNRAFLSETLDWQLDDVAKSFINDPKRNKLSEGKVELSKIFDWFKSDFTAEGDLIAYIRKYANIEINKDAKISFLEYDWSLNGK